MRRLFINLAMLAIIAAVVIWGLLTLYGPTFEAVNAAGRDDMSSDQ